VILVRHLCTVLLVFAYLLLAPRTANSAEVLDCLIEPYVIVKIGSAVNGLIETMLVDRGDMVKKGQVLATLESAAERAAIDVLRARATLESPIKANQARLELSLKNHERSDGMFQKFLIPADKMDEAETTRRVAEMAVLEAADNKRLAELELQRATAELTRRTIRSPVNGVVMERLLTAGEFAASDRGDPIMRLAQLDPLRVEVFVPVARLGEIAVGKKAEIMPQAPVNGTYTARVTVVDRVADAASGTFGVRLELPNHDYRIPAGLKCTVRFLRE
jgi:RND family efflux transporter MFP subunit